MEDATQQQNVEEKTVTLTAIDKMLIAAKARRDAKDALKGVSTDKSRDPVDDGTARSRPPRHDAAPLALTGVDNYVDDAWPCQTRPAPKDRSLR